ncbi:MAG: 2-C-methyl-D-erythritol 4-phosphate cytidylyltransferase [Bacteroidia bacterium]|nr:2-C-methyl-D-erythritol 4-phosphate cytidylyltransferase [Bacteroidia bacterium]
MNKSVIIVAGGNGSRMGGNLPKQFLLLENYPVLMWTILNFIHYDPMISIVVVLPGSQISYWTELSRKYNFTHPHRVVSGGETRFQSVKNGLEAMGITDLVAVHDGVRPLVSQLTISNCFSQAEESGAAIPVLPVNETLRTGTMEQSQTVDRTRFYTVQTPQVFKAEIIKAAYTQTWEPAFTDDASVVEQAGYEIRMVLGNRDNIKITHPEDLLVASEYLKQKKGTF